MAKPYVPTIVAVLAVLTLAPSRGHAGSGLQVAPQGGRILVDKTVGEERWAIVRSSSSVSGNVYFSDGSSPKFVSCGAGAETQAEVQLDCSGADRCTQSPCAPGQWTPIANVVVPDSFFEPDSSSTAGTTATEGAAGDLATSSGVQVLPDGSATLVNKDLAGERWSIARFADDHTVTGIVYRGAAADPSFVWCEQVAMSDGILGLRCSGADSCRTGPCTPDQWTSIGDVSVPESFFEPSSANVISADNAASLVQKWDFPIAAGVTAPPVVSGDFVYAGAWDGKLYALDRLTGALRWSYDTQSGGTGIQAGVTVLDDGDLVVGDSVANVYRLDGKTGALRWKKSVGDPAVDDIWTAITINKGRALIGIASHSDNPCTNGRTVSLDLATQQIVWQRVNVPDHVCKTDTSIVCHEPSDCPGDGECVQGRGAGVTAQPTVDPTGKWVYVNPVGCYTFPSIGDSDSIMKLDAQTGETIWLNRVQPPEQFGYCAGDGAKDCGTDDACGDQGPCTTKGSYHDFGFLNSALLIDTVDPKGNPGTLVVSGSKDGTLYALREADGALVWRNQVVPTPVSPGFAGFGEFDGAIAYEDGLIYAALNETIPAFMPAPKHLQAFDVKTGKSVWQDEIGPSWSSVGVKNGVLFAGTNGVAELYVYDAKRGVRLATFSLPATSSSRAAIVGDMAFVGYGIISSVGGVRAYGLP